MSHWTHHIGRKTREMLPISFFSIATCLLSHGQAHAGNLIGNTVNSIVQPTISTVNTATKNIGTTVTNTVNSALSTNTVPLTGNVPNISNLGSLVAPGAVQGNSIIGTTSSVMTSSGRSVPALDLVGDGLTSIMLDKGSAKGIANLPGHSFSLPASGFNDIMGKIVNLKGIHEAHTASISKAGTIILGGSEDITTMDVAGQNDSVADATLDKANHLNQILLQDKTKVAGHGKSFTDLFSGFLDVKIMNSDD